LVKTTSRKNNEQKKSIKEDSTKKNTLKVSELFLQEYLDQSKQMVHGDKHPKAQQTLCRRE